MASIDSSSDEHGAGKGKRLDKTCIVFGEHFYELIALAVVVYDAHIADNAKLGLQPSDDDKTIRKGLQLWHNLYNKLSPKQRYTGALFAFEKPFLENVGSVFANYKRDEWLLNNNIVITPRADSGVVINFSKIYSWAKVLANESRQHLLSIGQSDMTTDLIVYPMILQYRLLSIWREMLKRHDRFTVVTNTNKETREKVKQPPTVDDETRLDYLDGIEDVLTKLGQDLYDDLPDSDNIRIVNIRDEVKQYAPKKGGGGGDFISGIFDVAGPLFQQFGIEAPDGSSLGDAGGMESLNATLTNVLSNPAMLQQINGIHDKLKLNDGENIGDVLNALTGGLTNDNFIGTIVGAVAESGKAGADAGLIKKKTGKDDTPVDASTLVREAMSAADVASSSSSSSTASASTSANASSTASASTSTNTSVMTVTEGEEDDDLIIDDEVDFA